MIVDAFVVFLLRSEGGTWTRARRVIYLKERQI